MREGGRKKKKEIAKRRENENGITPVTGTRRTYFATFS